MNRLPPQEILAQQIALLQSGGGSLGIYAYPDTPQQLFSSVSFDAKIPTNTVNSTHINSLGRGPNSCLRTFIVILLKIIFEDKQNPQILQKIKCSIYCRTMDLTKVKHQPYQQLSNKNMKKLLVQFFQLMTYCKKGEKIQNRILKYPIILDLLTLSFRLILLTKNVSNAMNYYACLDPTQTVTCLSQFLHLQCKFFFGLFVFSQSGYFISTHDEEQFIYGHIKQSDLKNQSRKNSIQRWNEELQQFNQWLLQDRQGKSDLRSSKSGCSSPRRMPKKIPKISFGLSGDSSIFVTDDFYLNYEIEQNQPRQTVTKSRKNSRFLRNMVDSKQFRQFRQLDHFIQKMQKSNQIQRNNEIKDMKQNIIKNPIQERFIEQTESLGLQYHSGSNSNSHGVNECMPQFGGQHRNRIDTAKFDDFSQDDLPTKKCSKCFQSKKAVNSLQLNVIQVTYQPKKSIQNKPYPIYIRKINSQAGSIKGMKRSYGDFSVQAQRKVASPKSCSHSASQRKSVSEVQEQTKGFLLKMQLQKFNQRQSLNFRKCIEDIDKTNYRRPRKISGSERQFRGKSTSLFEHNNLRENQHIQHNHYLQEAIQESQEIDSPKKIPESTVWRPYLTKQQVRSKSKSLSKPTKNATFTNLTATLNVKSENNRFPIIEARQFSPQKQMKKDINKSFNSPRNLQSSKILESQNRLGLNKTINNIHKPIAKQSQKPNLNFVNQLNKKQNYLGNPKLQLKQFPIATFTITSPKQPNSGHIVSSLVKGQSVKYSKTGDIRNQIIIKTSRQQEDMPSFDSIPRANTCSDSSFKDFVALNEVDRKNSTTSNSSNKNNSNNTLSTTNLIQANQIKKEAQFQTFVNTPNCYSQMVNDRMIQSQRYIHPSSTINNIVTDNKYFRAQGNEDFNRDFNKKKIDEVNRVKNIHIKTQKTETIYINSSGNPQNRIQGSYSTNYMQNSQNVNGSAYLQNSMYRPFAKPNYFSPDKKK